MCLLPAGNSIDLNWCQLGMALLYVDFVFLLGLVYFSHRIRDVKERSTD